MGLFQKKQDYSTSAPLYRVEASKSVLVIGLGNPGGEYDHTRHNVGFKVLDLFATKNEFPNWINKKDLKCHLSTQIVGGTRVILCKPTTFMNLSGQAAQLVQHFYRVNNKSTLAVYDELAIPFGQLRSRSGGSDAGHNGVKSLVEQLGENFQRLRIGIGSDKSKNAAEFVLKPFSKEEKGDLDLIIKEASAMVGEFTAIGSLPHETRKVL